MKLAKVFLILAEVICLGGLAVNQVFADPLAYTQCAAVATPFSREPNQYSVEFFFAVTNQSYSAEVPTADMDIIRILPPGGVTIVGAGADVSSGNFQINEDGVEFEINSEAFPTGSTASFRTVVNVGEGGAQGGDFIVQGISALDEQGAYVDCAMSADQPPALSNASFAIQSESTVQVTWGTNEAATSIVRYGTASGTYDLTGGDESMVSNHSVTLAGLAVQSTYYMVVESTDSTGNTVQSQEFSVTMPAPGGVITETQTVVVTNTVTSTVTNTIVNKITEQKTVLVRDTTPPSVKLTTKWEKFYSKPPVITGTASDNKRINSLEYTLDKGRTWRPLEAKIETSSTKFEFEPPLTEEGNYEVAVRAYDAEGNKGMSKFYTVVLDRLPPLVGAVNLSWGPGLTVPVTEQVTTMVGLPLWLTLGAVGGPTKMHVHDQDLAQDPASGRWSGELGFDTPGVVTVSANAIDGFERETTSELFEVNVLPSGTVVDKNNMPIAATITIYVKNLVTGEFSKWDGEPYGQTNPSDNTGKWGLVLPGGTYFIQIRSTKHEIRNSEIFTLDDTGLVRGDVILDEKKTIGFGKWKIAWPSWGKPFGVEIANMKSEIRSTKSETMNKALPEIELYTDEGKTIRPNDWLGTETVLVLDAPWLPTASDSLSFLSRYADEHKNVRTVWVAAQSTSNVLQGIRARAESSVALIAADRDARLTEYFSAHRLPLVITIDRMGVVQDVNRGFTSNKGIL